MEASNSSPRNVQDDDSSVKRRPGPVENGQAKGGSYSPLEKDGLTTSVSLAILVTIFAVSVTSLVLIYRSFPDFDKDEVVHVKLPKNMEDAKHLGQVLSRYKNDYYWTVLSAVFVTYIFLQTFAIPGSIFLSVMSGFLFPFPVALTLVCFCSATGASLCYLLSLLVGRRLIYKYFPDRVIEWRKTVAQHKDNILNYMIFLRITPFLPNWFINISAPMVDVAAWPFWLGTFIGVAPPSFVAIQTGTTLQEITTSSASVSWGSLAILIGLGFLSLVPILVKSKLKQKFS